MTAVLSELDTENKLLLISPFKNAAEALDYVEKTKSKVSSEIAALDEGWQIFFYHCN